MSQLTVLAVAQTGANAEGNVTAFVGLTGLVISGFLVLARLSQRVVDGSGGPPDPTVTDDGDEKEDATLPAETDSADPGMAESPAARRNPVETAETPPGESRARVGADADDALSPGALLLNVALTQGLFGAVLAGGAVLFGVPAALLGLAADPLSTGLPALGVGVAVGVALWVGNEVASGLAAAVGADYDEALRGMLAPADARGWAVLLGGILPVIAVVEEFIFRAAAIGATTGAFSTSPWALAVVSSLAFALGHGAQGRVGIAVTGALGFALAAAFVVTNSLVVVVVAHYLVNALEFAVHEGVGLPDPLWARES